MRVPKKHSIYSPEMECMSREERKLLQEERLRHTVRLEYENVPLYRKRMDERGVSPEDIKSLDDLKLLPFMERKDLCGEYPFGMLAVPMEDIIRVQGSSGTTGKPILSGYTEKDIETWSEMAARAVTAAGGGPKDIIQIAYGYGLFTGGAGAHQGAEKIGATVVPMSCGNTQKQILMMHDLGVTMLCCTPSYATYIGETIRDMGMPISEFKLKSGCFGAEQWTEGMRQKLEELLDIDACDIYGLTEVGGPGVAFECLEKDGMHINEDHVIAEVIDPVTGEQLPYGVSGELVLTTITKEGMPMIRYRTHDICMLSDKPCACGRTTIKMGRITGRTDDMIKIRGVDVFPSQIESVLVGIDGVAPHYMLFVDRVNYVDKLEIQVEMTEEMFQKKCEEIERLSKLIKKKVKSVVGINAEILLVPPKTLPRTEEKEKRVIDNRKL